MLAHGAGSAAVLGWLFWQWILLNRLRRRSNRVEDSDVLVQLEQAAAALGVSLKPDLRRSEGIQTPIVFGLSRPTVLLPSRVLQGLSGAELKSILAHELAHLRRRDLWVNAFQLGLFVIWWFHPWYWLLRGATRSVREECCDDLLMVRGVADRYEYCQALISAARELARDRSNPTALAFGEDIHWRRLKRIMDPDLKRWPGLPRAYALTVLLICALVLPGLRSQPPAVSLAQQEPVPSAPPASQVETNVPSAKPPASGDLLLTILRPDRSPASNAFVTVRLFVPSTAGTTLGTENNADAAGRFRLEAYYRQGARVVVKHDAGYADTTFAALEANPTVQLTAWGRIEGQVENEGAPAGGWRLKIDYDYKLVLFWLPPVLEVQTGADGRFVVEGVPPGQRSIYRMRDSRDSGRYPFGLPQSQELLQVVEIRSGETSRIVVKGPGKYGPKVTLRLLWPMELQAEFDQRVQVVLQRMAKPLTTDELIRDIAASQNPVMTGSFPLHETANGAWAAEEIPAGDYLIWVVEDKRIGPPGPAWSEALAYGIATVKIPSGTTEQILDLGGLQMLKANGGRSMNGILNNNGWLGSALTRPGL